MGSGASTGPRHRKRRGKKEGLAHQLPLLLQNAAEVAVNGREFRHEAHRGHVAVNGLLHQTLRKITTGVEISHMNVIGGWMERYGALSSR